MIQRFYNVEKEPIFLPVYLLSTVSIVVNSTIFTCQTSLSCQTQACKLLPLLRISTTISVRIVATVSVTNVGVNCTLVNVQAARSDSRVKLKVSADRVTNREYKNKKRAKFKMIDCIEILCLFERYYILLFSVLPDSS